MRKGEVWFVEFPLEEEPYVCQSMRNLDFAAFSVIISLSVF